MAIPGDAMSSAPGHTTGQISAADEAARLEVALERIARAAARPPAPPPAPTLRAPILQEGAVDATSRADTAALAERLDSLIAELRTVLGPQIP
jgi:hypothetical protein